MSLCCYFASLRKPLVTGGFLIFTSIVVADSRIDKINSIENQFQSSAIRQADPRQNYLVPGTSLQIVPTPNGNGFVTMRTGKGLRGIAVYDPTVTPALSARLVDCLSYTYHPSDNPGATITPEPNSYGGALVYAACHLPVGN